MNKLKKLGFKEESAFMKKACMKCKSIGSDYTWVEKYDVANNINSNKYLSDMLDKFNSTLRENESAREILKIWEEETDGLSDTPHVWEKINLVTKISRGRSFDTYKCACCGITGKRFGLSKIIVRDSKYKAEKYRFCTPTN